MAACDRPGVQFLVSRPMQLVMAALAAASERPHKWRQRHELLGDWDAAAAELGQAMGPDGLADIEQLAGFTGWMAALRGDAATAETMLAGPEDAVPLRPCHPGPRRRPRAQT